MFLASRKYLYLPLAVTALLRGFVNSAEGQIAAGVGRFKTDSSNRLSKPYRIFQDKETIHFNKDKITYTVIKPFALSAKGGLISQPLTFSLKNHSTESYEITAEPIGGIDPTEYTLDRTKCALGPQTGNSSLSPIECTIQVGYVHDPKAPGRATSAELSITITDITTPKTGSAAQTISMKLPVIALTGIDQTLLNQATGSPAPQIWFNPPNYFENVVGDVSASQTVTITTKDPTGYTISTTTLSGSSATDFTVGNCVGARLDRNSQQCVLTLGYISAAAKSSSAQLVVTLVPDGQTAATPPNATITIPLSGTTYPLCTGTPGYAIYKSHYFIPLNRKGIDDTTINCYYNTAKNLAFLTSAVYQYNPSGSANTVSGDLTSIQFTGGVQVTLAGTATTSSCTAATTANSSSSNSSCSGSASSPSAVAPSLEQDIQSLTQGGDFAIKLLWPFLNMQGNRIQYSSIVNPRVGFSVNGLSATATAANATDINAYITNENYFQIDGMPAHNGGDSPASLFFDYRWGLEHIGSGFASTAKLPSNNFLLQQMSAGLVIGGSIRISAERYFGPSQVYIDSTGAQASANNFANWQLRVQFTPSSISAK